MNVIIDLLIIAIILYSGWRGWRDGMISGAIGVFAIAAALIIGSIVATAYAGDVADVLKPLAGGIVDNAISTVTIPNEENEIIIELTDDEKRDVFSLSYATVRQIGLYDDSAVIIAEETAAKTDSVGADMSVILTGVLCTKIAYVILMAGATLLILIIYMVLHNVLDLSLRIPGAELVNQIGGAVIGLFRGFVVVLMIACVFRYALVVLPEEFVEKTAIFEFFIKRNFIAGIFGI